MQCKRCKKNFPSSNDLRRHSRWYCELRPGAKAVDANIIGLNIQDSNLALMVKDLDSKFIKQELDRLERQRTALTAILAIVEANPDNANVETPV